MKKLKTILCLIFTFTLLTSNSSLSTFKPSKNIIEKFCDDKVEKQ